MNTRSKTVLGVISTSESIVKPSLLTVRFTSDERGETLSLSDEKTVLLAVKFDDVMRLVKETRKCKSKSKQNGLKS